MLGEQTAAVLHRNVQSSPVELHKGDGELKPEGEHILTTQPPNGQRAAGRPYSRLIVNRVQGLLERVGFPPARPPFVREQVEADVRVRAVVREGDQVPAEGNDLQSEKTEEGPETEREEAPRGVCYLQP